MNVADTHRRVQPVARHCAG